MPVPLQSRVVTDPDGDRWRVSVRWTPWWPRRRKDDWIDPNSLGDTLFLGADDAAGCLFSIAVVLVVVSVVVFLPVALFLLEVALLVVLAVPLVTVLALVGATAWRIEVELEDPVEQKRSLLQYHRGLRAADAAIQDLADRIERGTLTLEK